MNPPYTISAPPSSSGGSHLTKQLSLVMSNMSRGPVGGPGTSKEEIQKYLIINPLSIYKSKILATP